MWEAMLLQWMGNTLWPESYVLARAVEERIPLLYLKHSRYQ